MDLRRDMGLIQWGVDEGRLRLSQLKVKGKVAKKATKVFPILINSPRTC
jgi:hypothetical protein